MRMAKALTSIMFSAIISLGTAFAGFSVSAIGVSAEEIQTGGNAFDDTSVNDDLSGFDLSDIKPDLTLDPQIVYFSEYAFAEKAEENVNFGLYIYVYNPRKYDFRLEDGENELNMAVEYGADGEPVKYKSLSLHYCGSSTDAIADLILKFRVIDEDNAVLGNALAQAAGGGERRYDVAGLQLWQKRDDYAVDYFIDNVYYFSGYAKGYSAGSQEESTLDCRVEEGRTVALEVQHGFYRPDGYTWGTTRRTRWQAFTLRCRTR